MLPLQQFGNTDKISYFSSKYKKMTKLIPQYSTYTPGGASHPPHTVSSLTKYLPFFQNIKRLKSTHPTLHTPGLFSLWVVKNSLPSSTYRKSTKSTHPTLNTWAHIAGRLNPDLNPEARTKPPQFI
jgi:hypothetical protein